MSAYTENKRERSRCEIYSRVVGYMRPLDYWNEGKRTEFNMRKEYKQQDVVPSATYSAIKSA